MTHLFPVVITNQDYDDLPNNWNLWHRGMADEFFKMIENVLCKITNHKFLPTCSVLLSTMAAKDGGLVLQHPQSAVIPSFILTTKQNMQYTTEGIWRSNNMHLVTLLPPITSIYTNWKTSPAKSFVFFRKHYEEIGRICV